MTTPITDDDAAPPVMLSEDEERDLIARTERAVAATYPRNGLGSAAYKTATYVRNPANENRVLLDARQRPVTVERILATKPFRQDLLTRPGPGGRRLTYISGEGISRSLNEIFGHEGWSLEIKSITQTSKEQDKRNRWNVGYLAQVRLTLVQTGAYREDMGSGDSVDSNLQTAIGHAMKSSITDALKRAARHFGDKLGNSLYEKDFDVKKAPTNLFEALDEYERSARERVGVANVPKTGEIQQPAVAINQTSAKPVATNMPPPPVAPPVNHAAPQPPMITPNVTNKPVNIYQRNSLGAQHSASTSASARSSLDASLLYSTPRNNNNVPASTPLATNHRHTNNSLVAQQQPYHMRSILAENSAAVNPVPTNALNGNHVAAADVPVNHRQHQYPQQQAPLQRPPSSWGKRPADETTTEPPKARPRHNPYASNS